MLDWLWFRRRILVETVLLRRAKKWAFLLRSRDLRRLDSRDVLLRKDPLHCLTDAKRMERNWLSFFNFQEDDKRMLFACVCRCNIIGNKRQLRLDESSFCRFRL